MRRANRSNACYHKHSHDEFSFGIIDSGEAHYINQQQQYHIGKGATVTINPGDAHACNPEAGRWSYRMLFVNTAWLGELQKELQVSSSHDYLPFPEQYEESASRFQAFSALFNHLLDEPDPLAAESQLITFLAPYFLAGNLRKTQKNTALTNVRRARELIMDQLESRLTLAELAQHSGLSPFHLIRSYKKAYGQSPHAYQLDQRIIKAKSLLQQGNGISDTANLLGFADQSHFQHHFKKRLAITPGRYQAFFV